MARRSRAARPLYVLALLLVVMYGAVGIGVATGGEDGDASFTPGLALDLEGGTQLVLTPQTEDGSEITEEDINQAIEIIRQRVDGSGVAEAEITSQGGSNIVVAIPGEVDAATVDLITASAQMRMRTVLYTAAPGTIDPTQVPDPDAEPVESDEVDEDGNAITTQPTFSAEQVEEAAMASADTNGDGELSDTPETEPTSPSDQAWVSEQVLYDFYMLDCTLPENRTGGSDDDLDNPLVTCADDGSLKYILGPAELTGADLSSAQMGFETSSTGAATNIPVVSMDFTGEGGDIFEEITGRISQLTPPLNQFAIVLDGLVISAPQVTTAIPGGQAQISGATGDPFSRAEATSLANQLNFGSLPITFEVQSQEQISATLGTEQLRNGLLAGLIGLILVVVYSFFQYRGLALVTVTSLIAAFALTYGALLVLSWAQGYRLSLAGVAGLIIAIGMTADSFIVYFERIRDEVRDGRSLSAAVDHAWLRARRTIIASDAVNFLAAVVLYFLAVGGVRGFAFTLGLTTIMDLVVVILFTHPVMRLLIRTRFFGEGHPWSGLDPVRLGVNVAAYRGRGRVRSKPERDAVAADADTRTIAQRKAEERRAREESAQPASESEVVAVAADSHDSEGGTR